MIVVSNTSPLTNLAAIGQFDLLRQLYERLHIAEGVWDELNARGLRWPGSESVAAAEWVERHAVKNEPLVAALRRDLDYGEAESIALALELEADLVLMDEREGRHAAQRMGLHVVGVVGVLLEARANGAIRRLASAPGRKQVSTCLRRSISTRWCWQGKSRSRSFVVAPHRCLSPKERADPREACRALQEAGQLSYASILGSRGRKGTVGITGRSLVRIQVGPLLTPS